MHLVNEIAQLLANVATFLGIPIAIIAYLRERSKDRAEKEINTFGTLNAAYMDSLRLCIDHPQMSWYSRAKIDGRTPSDDEIRDNLWFEILICGFEQAFYLYEDQSTDFKRRQWPGWNRYILDWCQIDGFQKYLQSEITGYFDTRFASYMGNVVRDARRQTPVDASAVG